jgi:hypothetical protein
MGSECRRFAGRLDAVAFLVPIRIGRKITVGNFSAMQSSGKLQEVHHVGLG